MSRTTNPFFQIMPQASCSTDADKSDSDRWTRSRHVLLSWSFDFAESLHVLAQLRLGANSDVWEGLISCRDPAEFIELQREYVEGAMAQYRDYAQHVSRQIRLCANDMIPVSIDAQEP